MSTTQSRIVPRKVVNLIDEIDRSMLLRVASQIRSGLTRDSDLVESVVLDGATVLDTSAGELVIESHSHVQNLEYAIAIAYAGNPPGWARELLTRLKCCVAGDVIDCAAIGVTAAEILRGCLTKPANRDTDGRFIIDELRVYSQVDEATNWPCGEDPAVVRISPTKVDVITAADALELLNASEATLGLSTRVSHAAGRQALVDQVGWITGASVSADDDAIDLRVDRLSERVRDNGLDEATAARQLDDLVISTGEGMAAEANNGGLTGQLRFLLAHGVRDAEIVAMIDAMATTGHAA